MYSKTNLSTRLQKNEPGREVTINRGSSGEATFEYHFSIPRSVIGHIFVEKLIRNFSLQLCREVLLYIEYIII